MNSGRGVTLLMSSTTAGRLSKGLVISSRERRGMARMSARAFCVEPSAALGEVRPVQAIPRSGAVDVIVGPEGGWSVTEVASAHDSGAILMSLGARTLRADAVPIVALTALLTTWGELQ